MADAEQQAILATASAADLAFVAGHPRGDVTLQKPRLKALKTAHARAMPINTVAPAVTGTATVGQVLTSTTGTWTNTPTYAYQWRRRGNANIPGAAAATYTIVAADSGAQLECEVTGTNVAGSTTAKSNAITVP